MFNYKLGILMNRYDVKSIEGKARISGEMLQTIDKFTNAVLRSGYITRLAKELLVPEQALDSRVKQSPANDR